MNKSHRRVNNMSKKILRVTGIWPLETNVPKVFRLVHHIFRLVNLTLFLSLLTSSLTDSANNIRDLTFFVAAEKRYLNLLRKFMDLLIYCISQLELKEFYFLCVLVSSMGVARIVYGRKTENGLPLPTYYLFDTSEPPIYQIIYLCESFCITFNLMVVMITDFTVICFMKWLTVSLKIISSNYKNCDSNLVKRSIFTATSYPKMIKATQKIDIDIEQIDIQSFVSYEQVHDYDVNNNSTDCFEERLKLCIRQHQKIITIVDDLNIIFGGYMFLQVVTSTGLICLNGFQVIVCKDSSTVVRYIINLIASFIQLLFWCWYGNKFVSMADTLITSQWMSRWENSFSPSIKNLLVISMIQSLRPLEFHALGLIRFTIPTFVDIVKKSYSVFILLKRTISD
ncbi:GSCOCT00002631001.3-RA-CDS [Cotesia congregata]|uniref:Odorant receptor n=1 Tax=Cotesia congregata TaxID=51543 RepID=A0A8J2MXH4_COTCN|nr:GSCOCT00002631001.3-RA-CDS [Cotesia congregata]CAG5101732.1 olfactory receptor 50 [Cotesia congregata]